MQYLIKTYGCQMNIHESEKSRVFLKNSVTAKRKKKNKQTLSSLILAV